VRLASRQRSASGSRTRKKKQTAARKKPPARISNYVAIADSFARDALADVDQERNCHWVRQAASRYLKDRKRAAAKRSPFKFSPEHANDACDFIEKLPHVEGRWKTITITLHPAHVFFIVNIFGFRNNDGTRRFTSALLSIGRKNAKSLIAAAILLYCLCCEDEPGIQVISAATTGSQARIVFNAAKRMVETTPDLREAFSLETFANAIANWTVGGSFKPINSKASTQDGLNPSHVVLDEIHAHKSHDLLNVLQSAAGARLNALWLYTTTEGYETPGPWPEMRHYAQQVLNGILEADHFFALIFSLDEQVGQPGDPNYREADDDFDEKKWVKANPLITVNPILKREIIKAAIDAKQMPGRHAEFKIKRLNRAASVAQGWTNLTKWKACGGPVDLEILKDHPCWGGLDLAATTDLASYRLVWNIGERYYTKGWRWVPRVAVKARTERGLVPYAGWIKSGHLIEAGEEITDYDSIYDVIVQSTKDFNVRKIGYDDWNAKQILKRLLDANVPMEEFIQGPKSFHPAMKLLEETYIAGKLNHASDPILAWCASNLVARTDVNLNTAPDKRRSSEKIDDMVALLMAVGVSLAGQKKSVYEERGLRML
jgi:phage terminase large subunit-like protein